MDWQAMLNELNQAILDNLANSAPDVLRDRINGPAEEQERFQRVVTATREALSGERQWFGCPGASEQEISAREAHLGVDFPDSYRAFLKASNGFIIPGSFNGPLLPVSEVQLFGETNAWICELWAEADYPEITAESRLKGLIRVSSTGLWDSDYLLVEPMPPTADWPYTAYCYDRMGVNELETFADVIAREIWWQRSMAGAG